MIKRIRNTAANIAAAKSGPRQLIVMPPPASASDMVEQLPLILAVSRDRRGRQHLAPIPYAIEEPQAPAQLLRNFRTRFNCRLRTPPPAPREFIEIFPIGAVAPNLQPFALRQSSKQAQISCSEGQAQFALAF